MKAKLTVKQERFILEYIKSGNATQSAIKAGYSKATANQIGCENLIKLKDEIQKRLSKKNAKKVAQADEILELLTQFARGKMKEEQIVVEGSGDGNSVARIMKRKIANRDQLQALDKLARIHGLYNDKINIATNGLEEDPLTTAIKSMVGVVKEEANDEDENMVIEDDPVEE